MSENDKEKEIIKPLIHHQGGFVKPNKEVIYPIKFVEKDKSPEEKIYILLYTLNDIEDDVESKTFSVCIGRTMAYLDIRNKLQSGLSIDVHRSIVLTETRQTETETGYSKYFVVPFKEAISVYAFCVSCATYFNDNDFDIEDYSDGDVPESPIDYNDRPFSEDEIAYRQMLDDGMHSKFNLADPNNFIDSTNV